ncbi:MAG TPA: elongation factor P [Saprospiraceae bacterium]|nr:elongation factor P [Saprospiraceae bacterium]
MATTADIRNGLCLELNGDTYSVLEFLRFQTGRGPAFVRTKLKSLSSGKVVDFTFKSGHKIEEVRVERRKYQYLYEDDMGLHLMDQDTYDQINVAKEMVANANLLKEGDVVDVLFHAVKEIPLTVELPQYVVLEVTYSEPGIKGDTANNALKKAEVETGATIMVPLFVNQGDLIRIDTATGNYMDRVKK